MYIFEGHILQLLLTNDDRIILNYQEKLESMFMPFRT